MKTFENFITQENRICILWWNRCENL